MAVEVETEAEHALPAPKEQKLLSASAGESVGRPVSYVGSWLRKLTLLVLLLAAAALGYWKYTGNKKDEAAAADKTAAQSNRAIPVTVAAVQSRTMPIYLTALGTVTAYNTVTVKSRVDGQLLSVNVREGQAVRQGQVLAMIDPRPYEAAVAEAEGQLAKDQAAADLARAQAGRYTALYQAGVVSRESEQTQQSTAGASVGTLAADRAGIQAAKVNVTYTRITSPINGVVGLRLVDAGNIVHASDVGGLLVVTQLQPIAVIFTLPEDQLPQVMKGVRAGQKLVVEAYDRSQATKLATGTLLTVDNQIDTTTGTVKVKAVFDNKDGALFPNQFVNVRLILEQRQNSLVIPASGLQSGQGGSFVYLVKPCAPAGCPKLENDDSAMVGGGGAAGGKGKGKAGSGRAGGARPAAGAGGGAEEERAGPPKKPYYVDNVPVTVDLTEGSQVILKSGVNPGDQIVVDGQEKLKRYSKVDPKMGTSRNGGAGAGGATDASGSSGMTGQARAPGGTGADAGAQPDRGGHPAKRHGAQGTGGGQL